MDPQARLFRPLPLPGLFWPARGGPGAAPTRRAFEHLFCLVLPGGVARAVSLAGRRAGAAPGRLRHRATGAPRAAVPPPCGCTLARTGDVQALHRDVLTGLEDRRALLMDPLGRSVRARLGWRMPDLDLGEGDFSHGLVHAPGAGQTPTDLLRRGGRPAHLAWARVREGA